MQRTITILTIVKEGHSKIIPAKLGKIQPEVKEEMSFEAIVDTHGIWHTTEDWWWSRTSNAHQKPMAEVI